MANDLLHPYDSELEDLIKRTGGYIIDSYEKLVEIVDMAYDHPKKKANAYFGTVDENLIKKINRTIQGVPNELNGEVFRQSGTYSIVASFDSIRHMSDEKSLSRDDIVSFLDRMPDTIIDCDSCYFEWYYAAGGKNRLKGVLFKKTFPDSIEESFSIISNKKKSMNLQSLYIDKESYKKMRSAKPMPLQKATAYTSKTLGGQTSRDSIPASSENVNRKFSFPENSDETEYSIPAEAGGSEGITREEAREEIDSMIDTDTNTPPQSSNRQVNGISQSTAQRMAEDSRTDAEVEIGELKRENENLRRENDYMKRESKRLDNKSLRWNDFLQLLAMGKNRIFRRGRQTILLQTIFQDLGDR